MPVAAADDPTATLVLFHGDGCPHCADERAWLEALSAEYPALTIEQYEVWYDEGNRALLDRYAADLGFEPAGVPVTIVGDQVWIGFSEPIAAEIEASVAAALAVDPPTSAGPSAPPTATGPPQPGEPAHAAGPSIQVPLVGTVDLGGSSLLISTLLIGFADGINPCSLWVLAVLLAIVLHSGSRGHVAMVGGVFLLVTAGMYGLYIVGMYSALDYAGQLGWIRAGVAAVALAFGILQLKDGLAPGVGPSLSISPSRRPRLYRAMRGVARPDRGLTATLAGTAALAVGVSLLETPCTAGLPLLWTSMLADQAVPTATAVALFAVYMTVFLIDELILFGAAVITMRARHIQPEEGRALKIVSGSLLVTLAVVMLVAPEVMTGLGSSLLVFAAAGMLALAVWAVARSRPRTARPPSVE
ncbi:MAG: glutaredoxin family protein [Candidatus Nanopelagicales bacterium]|nr:glutaredoxin family protein [Candidatus Nanopelagicales bacterium]